MLFADVALTQNDVDECRHVGDGDRPVLVDVSDGVEQFGGNRPDALQRLHLQGEPVRSRLVLVQPDVERSVAHGDVIQRDAVELAESLSVVGRHAVLAVVGMKRGVGGAAFGEDVVDVVASRRTRDAHQHRQRVEPVGQSRELLPQLSSSGQAGAPLEQLAGGHSLGSVVARTSPAACVDEAGHVVGHISTRQLFNLHVVDKQLWRSR